MLVDIGVPITKHDNRTFGLLVVWLLNRIKFILDVSWSFHGQCAWDFFTCKPPSSVRLGACPPCHLSKTQFFKHSLPKFGMIFFQHLTNWPENKCQWQDNDWSMDSDDSPAKCGTKMPEIAWPGLGSMIHHDSPVPSSGYATSKTFQGSLGDWKLWGDELYPSQNDDSGDEDQSGCWNIVDGSELRWRFHCTPPSLRASLPLKNDGKGRSYPACFWGRLGPIFRGELLLNFRWVRSQLLKNTIFKGLRVAIGWGLSTTTPGKRGNPKKCPTKSMIIR